MNRSRRNNDTRVIFHNQVWRVQCCKTILIILWPVPDVSLLYLTYYFLNSLDCHIYGNYNNR